MCLAPNRLRDGTLVACRGCRLCLDNRLNDLVGRCLAEQATSVQTLAVTLTYRGDVPESAVLRYSDFQLCMKRLRKAGHSVRYIIAGEYGTRKGRAHWHAVLFFKTPIQIPAYDRNVDWPYWPNGFSYFQSPDERGIRYVLKYALKNIEDEGQHLALAMSKKPPLGAEFFYSMAQDMVEKRIPFQTPEYSFSHARLKNGGFRRFWLRGRMLELAIERYATLWRDLYSEEPPHTPVLYKRLDDAIQPRTWLKPVDQETRLRFAEQRAARREFAYRGARPIASYLLKDDTRRILIVAKSNGFADLYLGEGSPWIVENDSADRLGAQLSNIGLTPSSAQQVCRWLTERWQSEKKKTSPFHDQFLT